MLAKLTLAVGKDAAAATDRDWFVAAALALRDRIIHRWLAVDRASHAKGRKRVYYMSLEFLIGRLFNDVVGNLRLQRTRQRGARRSRRRSRPDAQRRTRRRARQWRPRAARRLFHGEHGDASAFPAYGYGIRYDHGLFRQVIRDGWQQEYPEEWLSFGNPWEFERPEVIYDIQLRRPGRDERLGPRPPASRLACRTRQSRRSPMIRRSWDGAARHVNPLRLWSARAVDPLRLDAFNQGDHRRRASRAGARRSDLQDPLPQRRHAGGAGAAAAPGIFFCLRLAAGPRAAAYCSTDRQHLLPAATRARSSSTTRIRASRSPS